ncbi:hypothetical protein SDRG_14872 [Saprolegnia diclina VS20]|uniref:Amino acid permease/ SLC12A domain-containing protein n=1 Tax=Saprolegnia diclina (strain VS20) TaxID=1156394 RepID=T0R5L3_SAPDV|nr:hypothetical protein SDRG_14872 [Saprolegnia diclina VS20]EQC27348.1 hypothetical protein SDRG_14872 [Saprolegnia diclina VS20]|eukprot:XP_008619252.1 hypothetical protein SDRG_14872 [Saprolegnia diclina VS20]
MPSCVVPVTTDGWRASTTQSTTGESSSTHTVQDGYIAELDVKDKANWVQIWAFGVVIVAGGQYYGWTAAYATGFLPIMISQLVMGLAFVIYMACAAEVCGKIAFSGGSYGLSRVTLGFYCGYLIGILELIEYITYAAVSFVFIGNFCTDELGMPWTYQPLVHLTCYVVSIGFYQLPGRYLWPSMTVFGFVCGLPLLLYILAACPFADLATNGKLQTDTSASAWATGDLSSAYFAWAPLTTWAYAGIESLTLVTDLTIDPLVTMPRGIFATVATNFLLNVGLVFVVPAVAPGLVAAAENPSYPLNPGFALGLGLSDMGGKWLMLPAQFGMAFGFVLPYARLAQALADSHLLPNWLGLLGQTSTLKAMIVTSSAGYVICLLSLFVPALDASLQNISILAASFCYLGQITGFVMLRTIYKTDSVGFQSPFGIWGAYFACFIYLLLAISIIGGFQGDDGVAVGALALLVLLSSAYYHCVAKHVQTISKEEYASIFRFSVMKFNRRRRKIKTKNRLAAHFSWLHFASAKSTRSRYDTTTKRDRSTKAIPNQGCPGAAS